jgi:hypothetical protein
MTSGHHLAVNCKRGMKNATKLEPDMACRR